MKNFIVDGMGTCDERLVYLTKEDETVCVDTESDEIMMDLKFDNGQYMIEIVVDESIEGVDIFNTYCFIFKGDKALERYSDIQEMYQDV